MNTITMTRTEFQDLINIFQEKENDLKRLIVLMCQLDANVEAAHAAADMAIANFNEGEAV